MERNDAIDMFKKIYPEKEIHGSAEKINKNNYLIKGDFPDGTFYFVATKTTLSPAYKTKEEAIKHEINQAIER